MKCHHFKQFFVLDGHLYNKLQFPKYQTTFFVLSVYAADVLTVKVINTSVCHRRPRPLLLRLLLFLLLFRLLFLRLLLLLPLLHSQGSPLYFKWKQTISLSSPARVGVSHCSYIFKLFTNKTNYRTMNKYDICFCVVAPPTGASVSSRSARPSVSAGHRRSLCCSVSRWASGYTTGKSALVWTQSMILIYVYRFIYFSMVDAG